MARIEGVDPRAARADPAVEQILEVDHLRSARRVRLAVHSVIGRQSDYYIGRVAKLGQRIQELSERSVESKNLVVDFP